MQCFLGDPDSALLSLETHRLALVIAKKTLDENRFKTAQKTMASRRSHVFQEQAAWQMGLKNGDPDIELSALSAMGISYI